MTKEEIIDNIARLNSETWRDREEVRVEIGKLLSELKKALEQQPCEDKVTITFSKGTLKYSGKGYVVYNKDWFRKHFATEVAIMTGYDGYIEQPTSDDCVSRTQAIEWIENLRQMDKCFGNYEDDYFPLSEVIDRLKNVPPVTPTQRWIPISERLPEVGEKVLCQCQANIYDVLKLTVDGWYYNKNHCYMSGFVIAWQPLPKPYEEKRSNKVGWSSLENVREKVERGGLDDSN